MAEDAAREACALAMEKWPAEGVPANPGAWLAGVARHKALDQLRREARRAGKEAAAVTDPLARPPGAPGAPGAPGLPWPDSLPAVSGVTANGPVAGLVILDALGGDSRLTGWPQFHIARGELLTRAGRPADAALAYRAALALGMSAPERAFIERRLAAL